MKDIIVIGAGAGGLEIALASKKEGMDVLLVEKEKLGGVCLQKGCIPTKTYHKNASLLKDLKSLNEFGIDANFSFEFLKAYERKEKIVSSLTSNLENAFKKREIEIIYGEASFVDKNTILVNNATYKAKKIVIATGSKPFMPPLEGINLEGVLTSDEILELTYVPKDLVIIGGGVIGIEMASIFKLFGSNVTVIEALPNIISNFDEEISKRLQVYLKQQGIQIKTSSKVVKITKEDNLKVYLEDGEALTATNVLVSVGRIPNLSSLALENAGIEYTKKGILVNDNFQTNVENIYAIGDVIGKVMLAHYASYSAFYLFDHLMGKKSEINFSLIPACVFSFPEVASIGLTKEMIEEDCKVVKYPFRANGKAFSMGEIDGFVKIISKDDLILGVHIIGPQASTLIHEAVIIMNKKIKLSELNDYIYAHPTLSEVMAASYKLAL